MKVKSYSQECDVGDDEDDYEDVDYDGVRTAWMMNMMMR